MSRRREVQTVTFVTFPSAALLPKTDKFSIRVLQLIAATNDMRHALKQIVRAVRRGARNKIERRVQSAEWLYLERMLCGHVEEAVVAFSALWNEKASRRRLRKVMPLTPRSVAGLDDLVAMVGPPTTRYRRDFLKPVRDDWAFHYHHGVYETALHHVPDVAEMVIGQGSGFSRYLLVDDLVESQIHRLVGGANAYTDMIKRTIKTADSIGKVVDYLLVGLLKSRGASGTGRQYVMRLERPLAHGQREAARRRLAATEAIAGSEAVSASPPNAGPTMIAGAKSERRE